MSQPTETQRPTESESGRGPSLRPSPSDAPIDPNLILARLEQIRQGFHRGLDRIESLARERLSASNGESEGLGSFGHSAAWRQELEEVRAQLQAEADRWEQERDAQVEAIEHDRQLLAEAWERLEREQIEAAASASRAPPRGTTQNSQATTSRLSPPTPPTATTTPTPRTTSNPNSEDSAVSQAILRQFEMLRRDVRRNGGGHIHA